MKKPKPKLPPTPEWDFREIDPILIPFAVDYEYARESIKVRKLLVEWLDSSIEDKTVRQHIKLAYNKAVLESKKRGEEIISDTDHYLESGVYEKILKIGESLTPDYYFLFGIIQQRPDFPAPWTAIPVKGAWNKKFSRVRLTPMSDVFEHVRERAKEWPHGWEDYLEKSGSDFSTNKYRLDLDFFANGELSTAKEIIADFTAWLSLEIKRLKIKTRAGKWLDKRAYPLKCLAALRLANADFRYEDAANELQKFDKNNINTAFIPFFENADTWSRATKAAKKTLARFESLKANS